jgi:creatinine amidohydrolase
VVLVPVGSVEPHGPHLPLGTDTLISEAAMQRAAHRLDRRALEVLLAPAVPYGVTDFATGFAGAVSIPASVLTAYLRAVVDGFLVDPRVAHVCLVNNHLEPAHDAAVRAAVDGLNPTRTSVACPLIRRWARTLSDEFKRGACHAGQYETSLVLAHAPHLVDQDRATALPDVAVSLSEQIRSGVYTFAGMGMSQAYAGGPGRASADEGNDLADRLATMIETEILERMQGGPP